MLSYHYPSWKSTLITCLMAYAYVWCRLAHIAASRHYQLWFERFLLSFSHDIFKNLYYFSVTSLYTESSVFLLYVKFSGSPLILHTVKYAVVNTHCDITLISLSLMARDDRLVFSEITAIASGFVNYSALKLRMLIVCFCYFISLLLREPNLLLWVQLKNIAFINKKKFYCYSSCLLCNEFPCATVQM